MKQLLKKYQWDKIDCIYVVAITLLALILRLSLRTVTTADWDMYWGPWIADLQDMGFSYLATDRYDYAPPFVYILWFISILPINPMTGYKGICVAVDVVAAIVMGRTIWNVTGSKLKSISAYAVMLLCPTIWTNSALWAQCDIIFMTFTLLCVYKFLEDKPNQAMIFYGIAFAFKLQTLFIFPFLVILWVNKKVKLQHFLWIPTMYLIGMIPAWIAGRPFMELINIYTAQGGQDVYCLSLKWANIYQIIGNYFFLEEYTNAGIFLIVGILMCILFLMAQRRYKISKEFIVQIALFFAMLTPYFLPHMHERYGCLADILAIIYGFMNIKRFYVPLLHLVISYNSYMAYICYVGAGETPIYYGFWTIVNLGLMIVVGLDIYHYIQNPDNYEMEVV